MARAREAVLGARLDFQCIGMDTMSRRLDGAVRYAPSFITTQSIFGRPEMLYSAATLAEFLRWSPAKVEACSMRFRSHRANRVFHRYNIPRFYFFLSPEPDRQLQNQHFKIAIMGQAERPTCPGCGAFLILALPPGGNGPRKMRCLDCDRPDPLKSEYVTGWFEGELQPPTKSSQ